MNDESRAIAASTEQLLDNAPDGEVLPSLEAIARLAAIVESSDDAIIGKTLEGVITTWNSGAESLYGYTPDEIIGRSIATLYPSDRVDELGPILEQVKRGERVRHVETIRIAKDGTPRHVTVSVSPIRDKRGTVTGAATVTRDMTEHHRAEQARRELEARLHQAQRLESIGQLAGGIAHDFNNLLAGIMNYAGLVAGALQEEMARRGLSDDVEFKTIADDVGEITSVAKRAAALTHQLLIFSRREVVQLEVLDLNAIVIDMEKLLRRTIGENVDLHTSFSPDLPLIKADRGQIEQVFMNLAVNARDAMPNGGRMDIATAAVDLDEHYALSHAVSPGPYVRLTVSDTGIGMTPDVVAHAFDPFFSTKPKGEGTGLGLATVYGIVTLAGGEVDIYSEPGLGTTIRVNFPETSNPKPLAREAKSHTVLMGNGETLLLVEDEQIVREPARRMLGKNGYQVFAAANPDEALAVAAAHEGEIDLLLTDVVMPGRSGQELANELVALRPGLKVLFMSGYSHDVIIHQGVLDDSVHLIQKPFTADSLLSKVRAVLDGDV